MIAAAVLAGACTARMAERRLDATAPASPSEPRLPARGVLPPLPPAVPSPGIPPELRHEDGRIGLAGLIDLALRQSPTTRAAWASARAAAAAAASEQRAWWPEIGADLGVDSAKGSAAGGRFVFEQTSWGPAADLTYLLADLGGRAASVRETRAVLLAANASHHAAVQQTVLDVEQAYYRFAGTCALLEAENAAVREAQAHLDASEQRRTAGVATIADVLQARTALSQAKLQLETTRGQVEVVRGVLAAATGIAVSTPLEVELPAGDPPLERTLEAVERWIEAAREHRPDLIAARAGVAEREANEKKVFSEGLPTLRLSAGLGRTYYDSGRTFSNSYGASLLLRIPLFRGFTWAYDRREAREKLEAARARVDEADRRVVLEVWTSYQRLKTATARVRAAADLMESATRSAEVARERYQAGVGSVLDLLTAQRLLESARAQQVAARTDWYVSMAQLRRDAGVIDVPASGGPAGEAGRARRESP